MIVKVSSYLRSIGALYPCDYTRRSKTCMHCNTFFCDVTKRNLRRTCSDQCDVAAMVAKRRANGTYVTTPEQNEKRAASMRDAYASGRRTTTDEQRATFSETMKRTWHEGKINTDNHWARTPEGRASISRRVKGKKLGPQPKMSIAAQQRLRTKREMLYTSARGGLRDDLNMYFRSGWEANFARILNLQGKTWEYEGKTFQLDASTSYTPDFYVIDESVFYEIKGRMDDKSRRQLELMSDRHPGVIIHVIDSVKYAQLRLEYRDKVRWEGK